MSYLFSDCEGVRLLSDSVIPPHALKGHQAVLRCNYDLEGDDLYSVKWYFNQKEFYRYIPTDNPKVTIFNHHQGVKVNVSSYFHDIDKPCFVYYLFELYTSITSEIGLNNFQIDFHM